MKSDSQIEKDIKEELEWEALINGSKMDVAVKNGRVTLSGQIDSYPKKISADHVAMRVTGVKAVNNKLKVSIPEENKRSDFEIEKAVLSTIKWNTTIDESKIKVKVKDGFVVLEGLVDWEYQRAKARLLAEDITGVVEVTNLIEVVSTSASSQDVKNKIDAALKRNFYLNTGKINVEVDNGTVILTGKVNTLAEKAAAETASWSAPGITNVINELVIDHTETFA